MNRPLVSVLSSIILGIVLFPILKISSIGAVIVTASFLIIGFNLFPKKFLFILSIFLCTSFLCTYNYYNIHENNKSVYKISIVKLDKKTNYGNYKGRKVILIGALNKYEEGDKILVKGNFKKEINIEKGLAGIIFVDDSEKIKANKFKKLTKNFYKKLEEELGEDAAIVISACLGQKDNLTEEQKENVSNLGIAHVISVSGFHMAIVYKVIEKVLGFWLGNIVALFYVIITGGKGATWRAFIMILILKLGKKLFKDYDSISALSFSACLLLLIKPYWLYDVGFNLAYLATLGIILFYKKFQRKVYLLPNWMNEAVAISLAAQVFTFPYIILTIKKFSFNFLLANILIIPIFTPIIILGNIAFVFMYLKPICNLIVLGLGMCINILNLSISLVNKIALPIVYISDVVSYYYISVLICIYFIRKGIKEFKKLPIVFLFISFVLMYDFIPKLTFFNDRNNKGVIIEKGFSKIFLTNSNNKYFIENSNRKYQPTSNIKIKNNEIFSLGKCYFNVDKKLEYVDIIFNDKRIVFTENKENINKYIYYDIIHLDKEKENIFSLFRFK